MNIRFPWLAKSIAIFLINVVGMIFDFKSFPNDMGGVRRCGFKDCFLVKTYNMFGSVGVFCDCWLRDAGVEDVDYILFKTGFDWTTFLSN
jgi:hypothetical protein